MNVLSCFFDMCSYGTWCITSLASARWGFWWWGEHTWGIGQRQTWTTFLDMPRYFSLKTCKGLAWADFEVFNTNSAVLLKWLLVYCVLNRLWNLTIEGGGWEGGYLKSHLFKLSCWLHVCVGVGVCVYVRERERECVCVCEHVCVCVCAGCVHVYARACRSFFWLFWFTVMGCVLEFGEITYKIVRACYYHYYFTVCVRIAVQFSFLTCFAVFRDSTDFIVLVWKAFDYTFRLLECPSAGISYYYITLVISTFHHPAAIFTI